MLLLCLQMLLLPRNDVIPKAPVMSQGNEVILLFSFLLSKTHPPPPPY